MDRNTENALIAIVVSSFIYSLYFNTGIIMTNIFFNDIIIKDYSIMGLCLLLLLSSLTALCYIPFLAIIHIFFNTLIIVSINKIINFNNKYSYISLMLFQFTIGLIFVYLYVLILNQFKYEVSNYNYSLLIVSSLFGAYQTTKIYCKYYFITEEEYLNK